MKFIQLNHNWNKDPVEPPISIEIDGAVLKLSFYMNTLLYQGFDENDVGVLEFHNCFQYRLGKPNDEGFFIYGESRYARFGVKWGEFYLVQDSDWETSFPEPIFVEKNLNVETLNHYLFYFKDETFECIAEDFNFHVQKNVM